MEFSRFTTCACMGWMLSVTAPAENPMDWLFRSQLRSEECDDEEPVHSRYGFEEPCRRAWVPSNFKRNTQRTVRSRGLRRAERCRLGGNHNPAAGVGRELGMVEPVLPRCL